MFCFRFFFFLLHIKRLLQICILKNNFVERATQFFNYIFIANIDN